MLLTYKFKHMKGRNHFENLLCHAFSHHRPFTRTIKEVSMEQWGEPMVLKQKT